MSIFSWNCRGIGLPSNIRFLKDVISQERPAFVFLCETIDNKGKLEKIRSTLGFDGLIAVDSVGKKWRSSFIMEGQRPSSASKHVS